MSVGSEDSSVCYYRCWRNVDSRFQSSLAWAMLASRTSAIESRLLLVLYILICVIDEMASHSN